MWRIWPCMRIGFGDDAKAVGHGRRRASGVGRIGRRAGARHRHRARKGGRWGVVRIRVVTTDVDDGERGSGEHRRYAVAVSEKRRGGAGDDGAPSCKSRPFKVTVPSPALRSQEQTFWWRCLFLAYVIQVHNWKCRPGNGCN